MSFKPLDLMWSRVDVGRNDSDTTLFMDLMYAGELACKLAVAGMVAAVDDDRDRSRYRHLCELVRADSPGGWSATLEEILTGPTAQFLLPDARSEQRQLTEKTKADAWQSESVSSLHACIRLVDATLPELPARLEGKRWVEFFARLRNTTRGHGAPPSDVLSRLCPSLEASIRLFVNHFSLFSRDWAYLHRNLSGKYRVTPLTERAANFDGLKSTATEKLTNGVYVYFDGPRRVDLVESTVDALDFYVPNGGFNDKRYEMLSYSSGDKIVGDATPYLGPMGPLPLSETQGAGALEPLGKVFTNLPGLQHDYVRREGLEDELKQLLLTERHPVVTLSGQGGIGKTSLALAALHQLTAETRFEVLLWFSARDLDLRPEGPKRVRPAVLNVRDMAVEFERLVSPSESAVKGFVATEYLAKALGTEAIYGPTLFVFDNFETVTNPGEVFKWIDTYVRPPNKILITTRQREFKGDYAIVVHGMTEQECLLLIDATAARLGVTQLLENEYKQALIVESAGHPYVIKILLGDVAKLGKLNPSSGSWLTRTTF